MSTGTGQAQISLGEEIPQGEEKVLGMAVGGSAERVETRQRGCTEVM